MKLEFSKIHQLFVRATALVGNPGTNVSAKVDLECGEWQVDCEDIPRDFDIGDISDGYHTFNELYEFRKLYNAALFNEWALHVHLTLTSSNHPNYPYSCNHEVHKSWKHYDGELCFGGGWFIVVAILPTGQISNHYKAEDWDLFKIPALEKALYPYDGHTTEDVIKRLKAL